MINLVFFLLLIGKKLFQFFGFFEQRAAPDKKLLAHSFLHRPRFLAGNPVFIEGGSRHYIALFCEPVGIVIEIAVINTSQGVAFAACADGELPLYQRRYG